MSYPIRVPKTFHPPEGRAIAAAFREAAGQIRGLAGQLRSTGGTLDSNWEGNSKNVFFGMFQQEPPDMENFASWLDSAAGEIESIVVTIYE